MMEQGFCNGNICPHYSIWAKWSECSLSCGGGVSMRTRICINGIVGDVGCEENDSQIISCNAYVSKHNYFNFNYIRYF